MSSCWHNMSIKVDKMFVYLVLVIVLQQFDTEAYTLMDFPSNSNSKVNLKNKEKKINQPSKPSLKNILEEIGTKPIFEETIYNETDPIKLCWADILYVNESNGVANSWHEYQALIYSPADVSKLNIPKTNKKYKEYGIEMPDGTVRTQKFEIVDSQDKYVISKHENLTCGQGKFLGKSYEKWEQEKKIVIRLSQKSLLETSNQAKLESLQDPDVVNDEVLQSRPPLDYLKLSDLEDQKVTKSLEFKISNVKPTTLPFNDEEDKSNNFTATTTNSYNKNDEKDTSADNNNDSKTVVEKYLKEANDDLIKVNLTTSVEEVVPKISSCSPLLTQLFSGHLILPGLCNMTKNDKIILQGDIFVSLKHSDEQVKPQPLFVIHENTEIESTLEKIEESTTPLLNLIID